MRDGVHIRLTLTRGVKVTSGMDPRLNRSGPTLIVLAEHKPPVYDTSGLSLITSSVRRFPPDCLDPKIHHCNLIQSILAKIEANTAGADDALMTTGRRRLAADRRHRRGTAGRPSASTSEAATSPSPSSPRSSRSIQQGRPAATSSSRRTSGSGRGTSS